MQLLGRVIGADGVPLDGLGPLESDEHAALKREPINPMARKPIDAPLDVGVRAINALLTVGRGQRLGLFAGSGVGKSTLLGMMTRYTNADVVVVGLIGERGREVKEFVEQTLGEEGRRRAVIVAAPADAPPLKRLRGAQYATAIAEWFRDRGMRVLLLMDSLTRYAQAQREIALAIGEPPATKGYPPSVFAMMPALVERAGNDAEGRGSITAFYTVLTEGDDYRHDPDRRRGARDPGRPYRAVARSRRSRPLPGHRHRGVDQPRDAGGGGARTSARGAAFPPGLFGLSPAARPDRGGRLPERLRSAGRPGDRDVAAAARVPATGSR